MLTLNPHLSWIYSPAPLLAGAGTECRLRAAALPASSARYPDYRPFVNPPSGDGILCVIAGMTRNRTIAATLQKLPLPFPPLQKGGLGSSLFVYCSSSPFAIHIMALISFYLNCKKESPENFPDFLFYQFYFLLNQFFNFSSKYFRIQFDTRAHCCCKVN